MGDKNRQSLSFCVYVLVYFVRGFKLVTEEKESMNEVYVS